MQLSSQHLGVGRHMALQKTVLLRVDAAGQQRRPSSASRGAVAGSCGTVRLCRSTTQKKLVLSACSAAHRRIAQVVAQVGVARWLIPLNTLFLSLFKTFRKGSAKRLGVSLSLILERPFSGGHRHQQRAGLVLTVS
jgi:hypothetical protein